jgi:hypothetical protein
MDYSTYDTSLLSCRRFGTLQEKGENEPRETCNTIRVSALA